MERDKFQALLDRLGTVPVDTAVARIVATCKLYGGILVTENTDDFPMTDIKKFKNATSSS